MPGFAQVGVLGAVAAAQGAPASAAGPVLAKTDAPKTESAPVAKPSGAETAALVAIDEEKARLGRLHDGLREREHEVKHLEGLAQLAKADPLEVLKRLGISYDGLTDTMLGRQREKTPAELAEDAVEARLAKFKAEEEAASRKRAEATAEEQYDRSLSVIREAVSRKAAELPLTVALGQEDDVAADMIAWGQQNPHDLGALQDVGMFAEAHEAVLAENLRKASYVHLPNLSEAQLAQVKQYADEISKATTEQKSTESGAPGVSTPMNGTRLNATTIQQGIRKKIAAHPGGFLRIA